jgi:chemotaxis protein CheD
MIRTARKENEKAAEAAVPWRLVNVIQGECVVLADPTRALTTILGSCISCCLRDPGSGIGGMNHFLLPADLSSTSDAASASLRYGVNAMEALMNQVVSRASTDRRSLEIKVFGGANVQAALGAVGHRNADFIEEFFSREGLTVAASHLRGSLPRKIVYHPASGKVMMRYAQSIDPARLVAEERRVAERVPVAAASADIELFD